MRLRDLHIVEARCFFKVCLDEIWNTLEPSACHAEDPLSCDRIEIRLPFEFGFIERRKPLETCKAEIGASWPKASVIEVHVFGKGLSSKQGVADEGGVPEPGVVLECGGAKRGVADEGGSRELGVILECGGANHALPPKLVRSSQALPPKVSVCEPGVAGEGGVANKASPVKVARPNEALPGNMKPSKRVIPESTAIILTQLPASFALFSNADLGFCLLLFVESTLIEK